MTQENGKMVGNHEACLLGCGSNNMSVWEKVDSQGKTYHDGFCFSPSCTGYVSPKHFDADYKPVKVYKEFDLDEFKDELERIESLQSRGWAERRITKATSEFYGVKSTFNNAGVLQLRHYPVFNQEGKLSGYKNRNCIEKGFWATGQNGQKSELFGQHLFPAKGKYLVITGGEEDAMAVFQVLRNGKYTTAVVSPTVGEGNAYKQIQNNWDFVSGYEKVVLMLDGDQAGKDATAKIAALFSHDKIAIWKPKFKDPCEYLQRGTEGDEMLKQAFWNAEKKCPAGIVSSDDPALWEAIVNRSKTEKIPLPPFAEDLQHMLRGGPALGEITLLIAASSVGKTSILNAFNYYWIFNAPYKVGIISLESDLGELGENILSIHLGQKLSNMYDEQKLEVLADPTVQEKWKQLQVKENGESRFTILDHQSAIMDDELKKKIEYLVKVDGCKIIILDPLTLALSGQSNEGVDNFNSWYLRFVKQNMIAAFNVLHVRKNSNGAKANSRGAEISEEDVKGSGSLFQTAMSIWLFTRDKYADNPLVRNTTKVVQSKARRTGNTGTAGYWYFDNDTGLFQKGKSYEELDTAEEMEELKSLGAFNNTHPDDFGQEGY